MANAESSTPLFFVKDCALVQVATGIKAYTLTELKDALLAIQPSSIYFHFWGGRLRTSFEHREYHNDFSMWAHQSLHDEILAERLEILDPNEYESLENLKQDIIETLEERVDEGNIYPWMHGETPFYFCDSKIVVFSTAFSVKTPQDLVRVIPSLSKSSLFYHFIDASRRTKGRQDDFSAWLEGSGESYKALAEEIKRIDPYLISLQDLQTKLVNIITQFFYQ